MNYKVKKIALITFILICMIFISLSFIQLTFAETSDPFLVVEEKDRKEIKNFTDLWIAKMYNNNGTYVYLVTQILDSNDNITGYLVDFKLNNVNNGYFELNKHSPNSVVNYALEGISCDFNKNTLSKYAINKNVPNKLYSDGFYYYQETTINNEKKLINEQSKIISKSDLIEKPINRAKSEDIRDYILTNDSIPTGTDIVLERALNYRPKTGYDFPEYGNKNCGPTNIFNIIKMHDGYAGMCNKLTDAQLYALICSEMNFDKNRGCTVNEAIKALKKTAEHINVKVSDDHYVFEYWTDYTRDINRSKCVYLQVNFTQNIGHVMTVVGYRETSAGKYFRIIDNLNNTTRRYLKFDKSNFYWLNGINGVAIEFKSIS